jgi:hypothetical protein
MMSTNPPDSTPAEALAAPAPEPQDLPSPEEPVSLEEPPKIAPPAAAPLPPARPRRRSRFSIGEWLSVPVLLPFLLLFLYTTAHRIGVPFNLEWNEAHGAEMALRFVEGKPFYPKDRNEWVPYMYTPLYHMLLGSVFELTGRYQLAWGRAISLLSSLMTMLAIAAIVRDRTGRMGPAVTAALVYAGYFEATGYWFDIARIDAMAFALCAWGMFFTLRRKPTSSDFIAGFLLFVLGTLTKQPVGAVAIACGAWAVLTNLRKARLAALLTVVVSVNFVVLYQKYGNERFFEYTVTNALEHGSNWGVAMPRYAYPPTWVEAVPAPRTWTRIAKEYLRQSRETPPELWVKLGRNVWMLLAVVPVWLALCAVRRRAPRGWMYLIPFAVLLWGGIGGFAKMGGFDNNFIPIFLGLAVIAGFALDGILRALPRWARGAGGLAFAAVLFMQFYQPHRMPDVMNGGARWDTIRDDRNRERRKALEEYFRYLDAKARAQASTATQEPPRDPSTPAIRARFFLGRLASAGLLWLPQSQIPHPNSRKAHEAFMDWLREKHLAQESVWVMHQQFYGAMAGHGMGINIDMARCAVWAGDRVPDRINRDLTSGKWDWLVLDAHELRYDWLPGGAREAIEANYDMVGILPFFSGENSEACVPVTGARARPTSVWRRKGLDAPLLGSRPAEPAAAGNDTPRKLTAEEQRASYNLRRGQRVPTH